MVTSASTNINRHLVVSIDYIKSDRNKRPFLDNAPDLIIVDEAHTGSRPQGGTVGWGSSNGTSFSESWPIHKSGTSYLPLQHRTAVSRPVSGHYSDFSTRPLTSQKKPTSREQNWFPILSSAGERTWRIGSALIPHFLHATPASVRTGCRPSI